MHARQRTERSACLLAEEKGEKKNLKFCRKSVQILQTTDGVFHELHSSQFAFQRHIMGPAWGLMEERRNAKAGTQSP